MKESSGEHKKTFHRPAKPAGEKKPFRKFSGGHKPFQKIEGGRKPFRRFVRQEGKVAAPGEMKPFDDFLKAATKGDFDTFSVEPFAAMAYADELKIKNEAFAEFWRYMRLPGKPEKIIPAVQPRHYRANSKRKAVYNRGLLKLIHPVQHAEKNELVAESVLETENHTVIYHLAQSEFARSSARHLAESLNYVIIRGIEQCSIILNVNRLDGDIVRLAKHFSFAVRKKIPSVISMFLYLDETRSGYYLESKRPEHGPGIKKIFGPDTLSVAVSDSRRLLYPPTAFSQVNESMIPEFLKQCEAMLKPGKGTELLDLYCGYGLIGLALADRFDTITGIEIDGPAIDAAAHSAEHIFPDKNIRYIRQEISDKVIRELHPAFKDERVVLDPPRSGTSNKVIKELGRRGPDLVLHIFCGIDVIPKALEEWKTAGYRPTVICPMDLFPGTGGIETLIQFKRIEKTK